jgi:hypothetical protein
VTIDVTERRRAREQFEAAMKMRAYSSTSPAISCARRSPIGGCSSSRWRDRVADMRGFVGDSLPPSGA